MAERRYAFRYYQDGRWFNDEEVDAYVPNEFSEKKAVLDLSTSPSSD